MRFLFIIFVFPFAVFAQDFDFGFPYGKISDAEIRMSSYPLDSAAGAVYLDEYGETFFEGFDFHLVHRYHAKIKVLTKEGLDQADFMIPLYVSGTDGEKLRSVKASSYTLENGTVRTANLNAADVFSEKYNSNTLLKKFAVPRVEAGSVIEVAYEIETPYLFNFREWEFQAEIPKMKSHYLAKIAGNYTYNISLNGFLKLTTNTSELIKEGLKIGSAGGGVGYKVDLLRYEFGMVDIPAFKEEEYMTAKKNFLSAVVFELVEARIVGRGLDKFTREWKDVEGELRQSENFGAQLRRNDGRLSKEIEEITAGETDDLAKAKKIYKFVQQYFLWNGMHGKYTDDLKAAIDAKKGSAADINLFLVGALQRQRLNASPVILSTRENGVVNDRYPVLSEFNYVIAGLQIGNRTYLLDATDDFHPFGVLPEKCLNGRGRMLAKDSSYWVDLKPADRARSLVVMNVKLDDDGKVRGTLQSNFMGYDAIRFRKSYFSFDNQDAYLSSLTAKLQGIQVTKMEVKQADEYEKAVIRNLDVEIEPFGDAKTIFFNPQFLGQWKENPFKSQERQYPVDFATPMDMTTIVNIDYPPHMEVESLPENVGLALPNGGGRFIVDVKRAEGKITLTNTLQITRSVYTPDEYHFLREIFQRVVETQNTDLLFRKKT